MGMAKAYIIWCPTLKPITEQHYDYFHIIQDHMLLVSWEGMRLVLRETTQLNTMYWTMNTIRKWLIPRYNGYKRDMTSILTDSTKRGRQTMLDCLQNSFCYRPTKQYLWEVWLFPRATGLKGDLIQPGNFTQAQHILMFDTIANPLSLKVAYTCSRITIF